jgi:hypothetical protein
MNYIPGFSNYLQAAVPRYADGGRVQYGEPMMYDMGGYGDGDTRGYSEPYQYTPPFEQYMPVEQPMMYDMGGYSELPYDTGGGMLLPPAEPVYTPAVEPMTQEAAPAEVPFNPSTFDFSGLDLSGLDNLYGMNFASDFGGGPMGGIYQADPNLQYISAPLSNKGNATSQTGGNTFAVRADQPVRLVDHRTNQIVFEGSGFDAARKATELGQGLTDQFGRKANYSIQTADPTGNYSTVAYEKKNKSTLGTIASIAGTALPLAALAVPGLNVAAGKLLGSKLLGSVALGTALGGAGAGLKGDNILKGALVGGLSSAGGAFLPKVQAIGDLGKLAQPLGVGVGSTVGNLVTGQSLKDALLSGVASGALAYAAPSIQKGLGIGQGSGVDAGGGDTVGSTGANAASGPAPIATVIGNTGFSPSVSIGGGSPPQTKLAELEPPATIVSGSASPFAAAVPIPANFLSGALQPPPQPAQEPAADQMSEEDIIKVTGQLPGATPSVDLGSGLSPRVIDQIAQPAETLSPEEILVEARKSFNPPVNVDLSNVTRGGLNTATEPTLEEILVNARETFTPPVNVDLSNVTRGGLNTATEPTLEEILVNARETFIPPVSVGTTTGGTTPAEEPLIKVTGRQTTTTPGLIPGFETPMPDMAQPAEADKKLTMKDIADYLRLAGLASSLLGGLGGSGKGGGSGGTIPAGMGGLSSLFSKQLPPSTLPGGGGGGALPASTLATQGLRSPQDYYRYGYGPEQSFFSYATQGAPNTSRAYTGYEGSTAEDMFAPQPSRLPQPITTPIPNNPAGPSMYAPDVDSMRFALGGPVVEGNIDLNNRPVVKNEDGTISTVLSMSIGTPEGEVLIPKVSDDGRILSEDEAVQQYRATGRHLGVFQNTEDADTYARDLSVRQGAEYRTPEPEYAKGGFAVEGMGDGRDDKIPALLSDGEYVIDAETVALLGNGSNKAGAELLDSFRVNVRKQKGKKLARGEFSDNAKRPEHYMAGGQA